MEGGRRDSMSTRGPVSNSTGKYTSAIKAGTDGPESYTAPIRYEVSKTGYYCVGEF